MSDSEDSEEEIHKEINVEKNTEDQSNNDIPHNNVVSITTSLNNLSISQDYKNRNDNDASVNLIEETMNDGYKIMYEATQRKLAVQNEMFKKKVCQLKCSYANIRNEPEKVKKKSDNDFGRSFDSIITSTPITEVSPSSRKCKSNECNKDNNEFMLMCSKCKSLIHYGCTDLPSYQVSLFLQKGYRLFQCKDCVGEIHSDILNNMKIEVKNTSISVCAEMSTQVSLISDSEIEKTEALNRQTEKLDRIADERCKLKNENNQLIRRLKDLEEEINTEQEKTRKIEEEVEKLKKKLQKQISTENISTNTSIGDFADQCVRGKPMTNNSCEGEVTCRNENIANEDYVTSLIDNKLEQFSSALIDKMTNIIDNKLSQVNDQVKSIAGIPETVNENYKSFKDVLKNNLPSTNNESNIRVIMNENRNEQLVQERERRLRASNIIVHGVNESEQDDKDYVSLLFRTLGVQSEPESITRLGKPEPDKIRPLKIKMKSESEKDHLMSRLVNLKNAEDRFKRISVTDDYTAQEREEIRRWVDKAREKNLDENGQFTWKVRGTPKNGLRLARIARH